MLLLTARRAPRSKTLAESSFNLSKELGDADFPETWSNCNAALLHAATDEFSDIKERRTLERTGFSDCSCAARVGPALEGGALGASSILRGSVWEARNCFNLSCFRSPELAAGCSSSEAWTWRLRGCMRRKLDLVRVMREGRPFEAGTVSGARLVYICHCR